MALKITASGWPNDVLKSDNPDRANQEFVIRNELEYGIKLDPSKIALNEVSNLRIRSSILFGIRK